MDSCHTTALGLYMMQHTKSLTLWWRSFSDWGCDHVAISSGHNGCQYIDSGYMPYQSPGIIQDAIPKIVDTLWTLYWRCVDALLTLCGRSCWGVAVSTDTILPIQVANTSIMGKSSGTFLGLYKMQHTKSLTLCWRSFSDLGNDHVTISFAHNCCQYVKYGWMP
jgi:hypothetical protein